MSKTVEALTLGHSYKRIGVKPFDKAFFLFVNSCQTNKWAEKAISQDYDGATILGCYCPWESMLTETDDAHCLGVIVCPKDDLGTLVHECAHAGYDYALRCYEACGQNCTDEEVDRLIDENCAFATGIIFEQIAEITSWEDICKKYTIIREP